MGCINSKKDLSDINPNVFRVLNVDSNGDALWNGHLEISPRELILHRKGREPTKWSLQHLRRYGFESDVFTFEAGRRCPTGEGIFAFRCHRAENLFRVMQSYIQGIALNDDINQQLSDMNLSRNMGMNGPGLSISNRSNRQSRSHNSIQNHITNSNYLIPSNRQTTQSPNSNTNFLNSSRSNDTFGSDSNYLEPTPIRNNNARYLSGARLSSVGSGPISSEPNSPGSPSSFTTLLDTNQTRHQQNYENSNIYHEFPFKSSESNNNLLNNKLSLDIPPQEPAPAIQMSTSINHNFMPPMTDEVDTPPNNQSNLCSPMESGDCSRMYVNVTPGSESIMRTSGTPVSVTNSQMSFAFPKLSSTQSMDLSNRCYENLELGEFRPQMPTKQIRYSKPDVFTNLSTVGLRLDHNSDKSEPSTPTSKEEIRKVNYIVLDLDNSPSSSVNTSGCTNTTTNSTATSSSGNTDGVTTIDSKNQKSTDAVNSCTGDKVINGYNTNGTVSSNMNNGLNSNTTTYNNNFQSKCITTTSVTANVNLLPLESPKNSALGYATIDFNKTVALSNSTTPSVELDNEGSRKTRHSSTAARQNNSISD